jgi:phenylacetyl-CoA:acceptor oxidoreductase subunit 1
MRWGVVIDLRKCIGCRACTIVCRQTNRLPRDAWRQVVDGGISEYPDRQRMFLPMSCMHCSEAPCLEVCPTTATYRRADGVVDIHDELCVGCGYCILACPYMARTVVTLDKIGYKVDTISQEPDVAPVDLDLIGVCTKCNFCLPRVQAGLGQGLTPGLDPEASPSCTISCSAKALHFGDLDDPDSVVSQLIQENSTVRLQEELGTDPSVYYIVGQSLSSEVQEAAKIEFIQPVQQKVWGGPAVTNLFLGGMAAGFYLLGFLLAVLQGISQPVVFKLLAPALVSLGFLSLTTEAGRPIRSHHLLRHLHRSWMSREPLVGAIFIPAAILDWLFPHPVLWVLALGGALGLLISQGFIIYRARGVTAWNVPLVPLLFLTSGFATGSGLVLLDLAVWLLYLHGSQDADFQKATKALRRGSDLISTVGIGHLLPILLLVLLLVAPDIGIGANLQHAVAILAGLAIVAGGVSQKVGIIQRAGLLRGIMLGRPKSDVQSQ